MLVVSRKVDQEILIGDDIKIMIVRVDSHRVRIGITAPDDVAIRRAEIAFDFAGDNKSPRSVPVG